MGEKSLGDGVIGRQSGLAGVRSGASLMIGGRLERGWHLGSRGTGVGD